MNGVRAGIACLGKDFFRFDDLVNFRLKRLFHVNDVDARRPDARDDQVTALEKGMPCQWRQRRGTGVPPEMVEFVSLVRHEDGMHDLAVVRTLRIDIDDSQTIG